MNFEPPTDIFKVFNVVGASKLLTNSVHIFACKFPGLAVFIPSNIKQMTTAEKSGQLGKPRLGCVGDRGPNNPKIVQKPLFIIRHAWEIVQTYFEYP